MCFDWQKGNDKDNPRPSTMNMSVEQSQALSSTKVPAVAGFYPTAGREFPEFEDQSPTVKVGSGIGIPSPPGVRIGMSVRRLLPVECEKLQGYEPGYTAITYKNKPAADGPRYKAIGNSMCVDVLEDILGRIETMEAMR
jgi:DNA (cytosine-5)-methyltransferase 1